MSLMSRVDDFQRAHPVLGFPLAVVYKFTDDQGPFLAAIVTYYTFTAIFPLMLIGTSILGFVLQDDPELQKQLLDTALSQIPIVGDQLGRPEGISGSTSAIIWGSLVAIYGSLGVGQSIQNAANVAWAVPRNSRPNPILMRLRSMAIVMMGGTALIAVAVLISLMGNRDVIEIDNQTLLAWLARGAGFLISLVLFLSLFTMLSLKRARWRAVVPGALFCAFGWLVLQYIGNSYVINVIGKASSMNQTFALVLGLLAFLYLSATMIVLGLEINVVRRRKMFPRALLTPFTDNVTLGSGDRRAYESYAHMQRHKGFQTITVEFAAEKDRLKESDSRPDAEPGD
jgi:membrane protein